MNVLTLETPIMYGDHHVPAVRRLLLALAGVSEVYASSAFQMVEVHYDPTAIAPEAIEAALQSAGYLEPLPVPAEVGATANGDTGRQTFFRHTATLPTVSRVVSFAQKVPYTGRPLWPCPGLTAAEPQE